MFEHAQDDSCSRLSRMNVSLDKFVFDPFAFPSPVHRSKCKLSWDIRDSPNGAIYDLFSFDSDERSPKH